MSNDMLNAPLASSNDSFLLSEANTPRWGIRASVGDNPLGVVGFAEVHGHGV